MSLLHPKLVCHAAVIIYASASRAWGLYHPLTKKKDALTHPRPSCLNVDREIETFDGRAGTYFFPYAAILLYTLYETCDGNPE